MYWSKQEQLIFDAILFVLVIFQIATFFIVKTAETHLQSAALLVGLNLLFFGAMIPYARWVWKFTSYRRALFRLLKHEMSLLGVIAAVMFLALQRRD